ncbi:hypothetical protein MPSEU_000521400 [Mayamaea pseudoterrestris]|nr:hypothetical protein MPSEU_000521400 [Mayamaea pseudoterrestris]
MTDTSLTNKADIDNMQPPLNREPTENVAKEINCKALALMPDSGCSDLKTPASLFKSADAFRSLCESGSAATEFPELFRSGELAKIEMALKHGDSDELDRLAKSSESQDFLKMFQSLGSLKTARSSSTGSHKLIPGVFESKDWAPALAPSHVEVDPAIVFRSEDNSTAAAPNGTKGIDWNALYEADLPKFPMPIPPRTTRSTSVEQEKSQEKNLLLSRTESSLPEQVLSVPEAVTCRSSTGNVTAHNSNPSFGKRMRRETAVKEYLVPLEEDVLLGRGGRSNHHVGNKRYLAMKEDIQPRYIAASKAEKTAISQELVDRVKSSGGRFLELDPLRNEWFEITEIKARKKASQTLREINTAEERAAKRARYGR